MTQAEAKADAKAEKLAAKQAAETGPLTPAEHKELLDTEARILVDTARVAQLKARHAVIEYPKVLYKARVRHEHRDGRPDGRVLVSHGNDQTFDATTRREVRTDAEKAAALDDGWFESVKEALDAGAAEAKKEKGK